MNNINTFTNLVQSLEMENIYPLLVRIFNNKFTDESKIIDAIIHIIKNDKGDICNNLAKLPLIQIGKGANNTVYRVDGYDMAFRQSNDVIDLSTYKLYIETIKDENIKDGNMIKRYVMSEPLFEIIQLSIMNTLADTYFNFTKFYGAFYCDNNGKMTMVMEKSDISLLKLIPLLMHQVGDNINKKSAFRNITYQILLQSMIIFHLMWKNGICDFDRHLDNMMVRYTHDNTLKATGLSDIGISPVRYIHNGIDYSNPAQPLIYNLDGVEIKLKNIGLIVKPIDFGQSVIEYTEYQIYNEQESYNKSISDNYDCTPNYNSMSYEEWELIKSKYGVINKDIRDNTMIYFFMSNVYLKLYTHPVFRDLATELDIIFSLTNNCGFIGMTCDLSNQKYISLTNGNFFVKRNIGKFRHRSINLITHFVNYIRSKPVLMSILS